MIDKKNIAWFEILLCSYLVLIFTITNAVEVPEFYKSLLSLPLFIIIPYFIGAFVCDIIKIRYQNNFVIDVVLLWCVGISSLTILTMVFQSLNLLFIIKNLYLIIIGFILVYIALNKYTIKPLSMKKYTVTDVKMIFVTSFTGLTLFIFVKSYVPFPYYGFNYALPLALYQPVMRFIETGYITIMNPHYPPLIILTGVVSKISNANPSGVLWHGNLLLLFILACGLYLFAYNNSKNKIISLLVVIFGVYLMNGHSLLFDVPANNFRTNTLLYALFPLMLYTVQKATDVHKKYNFKYYKYMVFILSIYAPSIFILNISPKLTGMLIYRAQILTIGWFLLLLSIIYLAKSHFSKIDKQFMVCAMPIIVFTMINTFEGLIFSFFLLSFMFFNAIKKSNLIILAYLLLLISSIYIYLQSSSFLSLEVTNPLSSLILNTEYGWNLDFNRKYEILSVANGALLFNSFLIGLFVMALSKRRANLLIIASSSLILFIYFFPDTFTYRIYKVLVPFMAYVIAYLFYFIFEKIAIQYHSNNYKKHMGLFCISIIIIIVTPNLITPVYERYSEIPEDQTTHDLISSDEYQMIEFLSQNTRENERIVSDFQTMFFMNPSTNKIWVGETSMMENELSKDGLKLQQHIKNKVFLANNSIEAYDAILEIHEYESFFEMEYINSINAAEINKSYIIVISGRTVKWISESGVSPIIFPQNDEIPMMNLEIFNDTNYFTLLYNIDNKIYAFEVMNNKEFDLNV